MARPTSSTENAVELPPIQESSSPQTPSDNWEVQITIFTTLDCQKCRKVKQLLEMHGLNYNEVDIDASPNRLDELMTKTGSWKVPQVFANSTWIGGLEDLLQLNKSDFARDLCQKMVQETHERPPEKAVSRQFQLLQREIWSRRKRRKHKHLTVFEAFESIKTSKEGLKLQNVWYNRSLFKNCFSVSDLVDRLMTAFCPEEALAAFPMRTLDRRDRALNDAYALLQQGAIVCISTTFADSETCMCQFSDERKRNKRHIVLNGIHCEANDKNTVVEISIHVIRHALRLFGSISDRIVRTEFKSRKIELLEDEDLFCAPLTLCLNVDAGDLKDFELDVAQLRYVNLDGMCTWQRMVFFTNVYNTMFLHGLIKLGITTPATFQHKQLFDCFCYEIGQMEFTLSDIEYGIFRLNAKKKGWGLKKTFAPNDPRCDMILEEYDPRILLSLASYHASLVAVPVMTLETMDQSLSDSLRQVVKDGTWCIIDTKAATVTLPITFKICLAPICDHLDDIVVWLASFLHPNRLHQLSSIAAKKKIHVLFHSTDPHHHRCHQFINRLNNIKQKNREETDMLVQQSQGSVILSSTQ